MTRRSTRTTQGFARQGLDNVGPSHSLINALRQEETIAAPDNVLTRRITRIEEQHVGVLTLLRNLGTTQEAVAPTAPVNQASLPVIPTLENLLEENSEEYSEVGSSKHFTPLLIGNVENPDQLNEEDKDREFEGTMMDALFICNETAQKIALCTKKKELRGSRMSKGDIKNVLTGHYQCLLLPPRFSGEIFPVPQPVNARSSHAFLHRLKDDDEEELVTPTIVLAEFIFYMKVVSLQKVLTLTTVSFGVAAATVTDLVFHLFEAFVALAWKIPSAVNKILWSREPFELQYVPLGLLDS
ncbi:hypothetical protein KSP40_PGU011916 [Platanthera guangdongensis]|uniref:Uncharacterized protein n=1 Tax=Platanthera guangdongensis TaxID=2320717 RepID=A0ABR2LQN1_9ASPA